MNKRKLRRARQHFKTLAKRENAGEIQKGKTLECLASWISSAKYGNTETVIKNMVNYTGGLLNEI